MTPQKTVAIILIAAAVVLVAGGFIRTGPSRKTAAQQRAQAPAGFTYDYTIDGYSRLLPDGSKEYLV